MKCVLNNNSSSMYFGQNTQAGNNMKNGSLNFGVVAPPDKLPNSSVYSTVYSNNSVEPQKQLQLGGGAKITSGKISAGCAFLAIGMSLLSFLPFIRKH